LQIHETRLGAISAFFFLGDDMSATGVVLVDPFFSFDGVDLSAQCREIQLNFSLDELEKTASGDGSHCFIAGIEKPACQVRLVRNYGTGSVDATLWAAKGETTNVIIRRAVATKGASNPEYTFTAFASNFPLLSGAVGTLEEITVTLSFGSAVARAIA
jgi:hypothetical protein